MKDKKQKNKLYFKKIFLPIIILMIFVISSGYYFYKYYAARELEFSQEDKFLLCFTLFIALISIITFVYNQIDKSKMLDIIVNLENDVIELGEDVAEVEDNCVLINRDTQEMIGKYLGKDKKFEKK